MKFTKLRLPKFSKKFLFKLLHVSAFFFGGVLFTYFYMSLCAPESTRIFNQKINAVVMYPYAKYQFRKLFTKEIKRQEEYKKYLEALTLPCSPNQKIIDDWFSDPGIKTLAIAVDNRNAGTIDYLLMENLPPHQMPSIFMSNARPTIDPNLCGKNNMTVLLWSYYSLVPSVWYETSNYSSIVNRDRKSRLGVSLPESFNLYLNDRLRCIERLLYYAADPNVKYAGDNASNNDVLLSNGCSLTFMSAAVRLLHPTLKEPAKFNLFPTVLKYGGDPNIVYTKCNATPLFAAANPNWGGIVMDTRQRNGKTEYFKKHYSYLQVENSSLGGGSYPRFFWASPLNVGLLIDAGADIEHYDRWSNTPLIAAAGGENYDIVLMLLEAGAKYEGESVVKYLQKSKQKNPHISTQESIDPYYNKVVDFLKAKGALSDADIDVLTAPPPDNVKPFVDPIPGARRPFDPYADEWIQKRKEKLKDE